MKYCSNCGSQISDQERICNFCGAPTSQPNRPVVNDAGGFGWGLLGFCIPIVGLVLFLVWNQERPNTARALITGAIIGFILEFAMGILLVMMNAAL